MTEASVAAVLGESPAGEGATWQDSRALQELDAALVHDLAHADAQHLHVVVLRVDARLLQQQQP